MTVTAPQARLWGALEKLGFTGGSRSDTELNQWQNSEKEHLAKIMLEYGIEWEKKGNQREHLSVLDYKKEVRSQEVAELEKVATAKQIEIDNLENKLSEQKLDFKEVKQKKVKLKKLNEDKAKYSLIGSKVTLDKEEFEDIKSLAQKHIVSKQKDKELETKIRALNSELTALKQENEEQRQELFQYKSVKNKMNMSKLLAENEQLKKFQEKVMSFLEIFNLKEQFNKFINRNEVQRDKKTHL